MAVVCDFCGQPSEYLSLKQTARLLKCSPKTIRSYLKQGRFPGATMAWSGTGRDAWRIPATAVLPLIKDSNG